MDVIDRYPRLTAFVAGFICGTIAFVIYSQIGLLKEVIQLIRPYSHPYPKITPVMPHRITPTPTKAPARKLVPQVEATGPQWTGKVSHYSRAGCMGCSPNLTMANGETLDDTRATIAFNWLPMNTRVKITNLDNGKSIVATVTDTGGFNGLGPYGRIADLTPAVYSVLETQTDVSDVLIQVL